MSTLCMHTTSTSSMLAPTTNTPQSSRAIGPLDIAKAKIIVSTDNSSGHGHHSPPKVSKLPSTSASKLAKVWQLAKSLHQLNWGKGIGTGLGKNTTNSSCSYWISAVFQTALSQIVVCLLVDLNGAEMVLSSLIAAFWVKDLIDPYSAVTGSPACFNFWDITSYNTEQNLKYTLN